MQLRHLPNNPLEYSHSNCIEQAPSCIQQCLEPNFVGGNAHMKSNVHSHLKYLKHNQSINEHVLLKLKPPRSMKHLENKQLFIILH